MGLQENVMTQAQNPASRKRLYEKMVGTVVAAVPRTRAIDFGPFFYVCSSRFLDGTSAELFNLLK